MKTKVILHTFPPVSKAYSITPFGIKVESWLRVKGIDYDIVYTSAFGPKKKIPYIHLVTTSEDCQEDSDVEVIGDSNCIIQRLENEFNIKKEDLSKEQSAIALAVTRMLEEHTTQITFYYRYCLEMDDFMSSLDIRNRLFSGEESGMGAFVAKMFGKGMQKGFQKKMKMRGLLGHTDEELWEFSKQDLKAVSDLLGDKQYFFGGSKATTIDCTMFAHLSQIMYIPLTNPFPQRSYIENECPNLVEFMNRFKATYWNDWDLKASTPQRNAQFFNEDGSPKGMSGIMLKKLKSKLLPAIIVVGVACFIKTKYY